MMNGRHRAFTKAMKDVFNQEFKDEYKVLWNKFCLLCTLGKNIVYGIYSYFVEILYTPSSNNMYCLGHNFVNLL